MPRALYILFGAGLTLGCAYALGRLLFAKLRLQFYKEEERVLALICGASLLHLIVFALCATQLARRGVILAVGVAILAACWRYGAFRTPAAESLPPLPRLWKWIFYGVYGAYAFLYLANAMAPETSPDGSSYHLGFVARYLRDRGFSYITNNMYANLTQGVEMLYLFAFTFGRHSAGSLVHCGFTLTLPLLMMAHARRHGFPVAGVGGALLLLCSPVVGIDGTSAYNDLAVTSIVFAVYCLLRIWEEQGNARLLIPIGLVGGYAFAAKYTAALALIYAGVFVLWKSWKRGRPILRPVTQMALCAALMMTPWMAKNAIIIGNPLSPFANRFFPNPHVRISFEKEYVERMRHYGDPKSVAEIPLDLTVHGAKFAGMLGPVYVLTPLALFALRWPQGRNLLLAAAIFVLPYFSNIGTRFLLPALPFLSLAFAMGVERSRGILPALVVLHAVISWPHVLKEYCSPYAWILQRIPVAAALRLSPEEKYLTIRHHGYVLARMVEDFVPPGERVFTYSGVSESYTNREVLVAYMSGFNSNLGEMLWAGLYPDAAPIGRVRFNFDEQPLRRLRLVQTHNGTDEMSVCEFRVLHQDKELPRLPEWRLRAWPNPWDVRMAFDNSPVTRWKSWEQMRPGMFVEADLGAERSVDSVLLETTRDQGQIVLELYGQGEKGGWKRLGKAEKSEVPLMRGLRRAAMEELRARGVRYLLVSPDDPGSEEFRTNGKLWGVKLLAERGGTKLYAIQSTIEENP